MRSEVASGVEELRAQFAPSSVTATEDGSGGAHVFVETVDLGPRFTNQVTWIGGHLTAQYPYADVYPIFIGNDVQRADGVAFQAPVTPNTFAGRPAWQVSRRNPGAQVQSQSASAKFLRVIHFLQTMP
jgi:hypothetical protein